MAKRGRPRKTTRKRKNSNSNLIFYILGVVFVAVGIFGLLGYKANIVGKFCKGFGMFLMGSFYYVPLIVLILLGGYIFVKNKFPKVFTFTKCGIYLVTIGILSFFNLEHLSDKLTIKEELVNALSTFNLFTNLSFL